jgi:hypothetical protein
LLGLRPEAEYRIYAAVDGHLGDPTGVRATAVPSDVPDSAVPVAKIEVLPVFGVLAQFVDAVSGLTLPDTFAQSANLTVESQPGELITLAGLALDELGLPESVAMGNQPQGIRVLLFRVRSIEVPSDPLVLAVEELGFAPARSALPLAKLSPQMPPQVVRMFPVLGSHHPVTLRIAGFPEPQAPRPPPPYQLHLDSSVMGVRACLVSLDSSHEVHLALPPGRHRLRFVTGGGAIALPSSEQGGWLDFEVAGATTVELEWPRDLRGVTLDVRDVDGFPVTGMLAAYWNIEPSAEAGPPTVARARPVQAVMFDQPPYWMPNLSPGTYRFWLDKPMSGAGYRVDVPRLGADETSSLRVRLDRR